MNVTATRLKRAIHNDADAADHKEVYFHETIKCLAQRGREIFIFEWHRT
jgi:hypothetical protein